jgi:hypothetical protein
MILAAVSPAARGQLPQPRLTSLARAGMRAGETVEVTLRGTDLEGVTRLWFDHPGGARQGPDVPGGLRA